MDADFCVAALEEVLARCGKPEMFNTDQGSHVTRFAFTNAFKDADIGANAHDVDGVADYVGGAALAFGASGHGQRAMLSVKLGKVPIPDGE